MRLPKPGRMSIATISVAGAVLLLGCAQAETESAMEEDVGTTAAPEPMAEEMAADEPAAEEHFEPIEPEAGEPEG